MISLEEDFKLRTRLALRLQSSIIDDFPFGDRLKFSIKTYTLKDDVSFKRVVKLIIESEDNELVRIVINLHPYISEIKYNESSHGYSSSDYNDHHNHIILRLKNNVLFLSKFRKELQDNDKSPKLLNYTTLGDDRIKCVFDIDLNDNHTISRHIVIKLTEDCQLELSYSGQIDRYTNINYVVPEKFNSVQDVLNYINNHK